MIRLILLTDFTEAFARYLLRGILKYSKGKKESWIVCRMPPSYKQRIGISGVVNWAKKWKANAIIGQFDIKDDVSFFAKNGILALAQDYKTRFSNIPNITSNYHKAGRIAADFFIGKGYKNFAFFGYEDAVWSLERKEGYFEGIRAHGLAENFHEYNNNKIDNLWYYDSEPLITWLKALPLSTALFACDDNQAIKITEVCRTIDIKIPEEIAVLGVDNDTVVCNLSDPPISSIQMDVEMAGLDAATLIDQMLKDEKTIPHDIFIKPLNIVNRISTDLYPTRDPYVLTAIKYIHKNIAEKINVTEIVAQVPLSRRLLETRFRKETGQAIYQYILKHKIERFSQLLLLSDKPISEIATEVGFFDYKNVARKFKSIKKCSPLQYRSQNKVS